MAGGGSTFLAACRREPVSHVPVWFMRQAGRSLPEYRALRERHGMLEACTTPDLIVEITLQPLRRYPVDAAILFSDIVLPLYAAGVGVDIVGGVGPVVAEPIRSRADLNRLPTLDPADIGYIDTAVRTLIPRLHDTPLIAFAGAPFTLASYLVEGGPSRHHDRTKALMYAEPDLWHELLSWLADITATFLRVQLDAGASALQLFDSWVGALSADDYADYVAPHSAAVYQAVAHYDVPRIHFGVGTGELLRSMAAVGTEVVGVDWRVPLDVAVARIDSPVVLQGNLDPAVLLAPWSVIEARTRDVLARGKAAAGHVFNLGHGVLPETDPDVLARLVDFVQTETAG